MDCRYSLITVLAALVAACGSKNDGDSATTAVSGPDGDSGAFPCDEREDTVTLSAAEVAELAPDGMITDDVCEAVCRDRLVGDQDEFNSCAVVDSAGSTGASGGSSGSSTGDPDDGVTIECQWTAICYGVGRAHTVVASTAPLPRSVGAWLATAAHGEAASVGSFLALRRELRAHGAPGDLCRRALQAAHDEARHAAAMRALARTRGAEPVRARFRRAPVRDLETLATENAVEGCVRETWSALEGLLQARDARASDVRSAMAAIARDEVGHAQLAWDIDAWLHTRLDPAARARVARARRNALADLPRLLPRLESRSRRMLGLPSHDDARALIRGLSEALTAGCSAAPPPAAPRQPGQESTP